MATDPIYTAHKVFFFLYYRIVYMWGSQLISVCVGGCFYLKLSGTEAEEAELLDACVAGATNQLRPFSFFDIYKEELSRVSSWAVLILFFYFFYPVDQILWVCSLRCQKGGKRQATVFLGKKKGVLLLLFVDFS